MVLCKIIIIKRNSTVGLTLASGLHIGEEARILLFVAIEVRVWDLREDGVIRSWATCTLKGVERNVCQLIRTFNPHQKSTYLESLFPVLNISSLTERGTVECPFVAAAPRPPRRDS